jgi:DNA polymerase III epsilon subunit-like protein
MYIVFDIETTGLRACESRITCICAKSSKGDWFKDAELNEVSILKNFNEWLEKRKIDKFISANGKDFDVPFILMRSYILNIPFNNDFYNLSLKKNHFDIINDITDKKISLNNLARLYGLNLKSGNGLNAIDLFNKKDFNALIHYCSNDVRLTEKVFLAFQRVLNKKIDLNVMLMEKDEFESVLLL